MVREAVMDLRNEFSWLTPKYEAAVKQLPVGGEWYIVRAASEAITDHRSEGDQYRRLLEGDELHAIARTGIGKTADINHMGMDEYGNLHPEYTTDTHTYDGEYDKERKEIQFLVNVQDPEIIEAINNGIISAVSINGGSPRSEDVECGESECFLVPRGVVLGELDNIAFTWVVTDPRGMTYQGKYIPPATPGIKNTAIEPL